MSEAAIDVEAVLMKWAAGLIEDPPEPMALPGWVPPAVARVARYFTLVSLSEQHNQHKLAILRRLTIDPRMKRVWTELTRRDRKTGEFLHPTKWPSDKPQLTQDEAQAEALARLFHFVFSATRDRVAVSKPSDIAPSRNILEERARILREVADDLYAINSADSRVSADATTLRRVAAWQDQAIEALRQPTDLLSIQNDRGDRVVRGVQILIAKHLLDVFGGRLDSTAATLTAVALDLKATSPRVSRSAFSTRKPPQKS